MASVNALARELVFKIVYYGPGLSGKTTTLQHIHATAKPEHRGKMVSLATPVDRTLYFDFLPLRLPCVRGMGVRLQLFTVPGQVYYNATRRLVLTGTDGIVFVSDSQAARMDANFETLQNLNDNLREHGRELSKVPHIVQHNKRDLPEVLELSELDRLLNAHRAPSFGTVATSGDGVYESLEGIAKLVLHEFEAGLPDWGQEAASEISAVEGGLAEALRGAEPTEFVPEPSPVLSAESCSPTSIDEEMASVEPDAPGERAARALVMGPSPAFSMAGLWPEHERDAVRQVESAIAAHRFVQAVELCDALVARVFASAATVFGAADAPRDAASVPLLLGVDGRSYLGFRELVRAARSGAPIGADRALAALVFAANARILRRALQA